MQQYSPKKISLSRIGAGLVFILGFATFIPPAFARQPEMIPVACPDFSPPRLIAMAEPPDFLTPAPSSKTMAEKEREAAITPFIGTSQTLTLLSTPERPAIAASDAMALERPEVTAGVDVDLGTVKFNLGYTLPSAQVDEFIRPLGVEFEPGADGKCFSLGVEIPF